MQAAALEEGVTVVAVVVGCRTIHSFGIISAEHGRLDRRSGGRPQPRRRWRVVITGRPDGVVGRYGQRESFHRQQVGEFNQTAVQLVLVAVQTRPADLYLDR